MRTADSIASSLLDEISIRLANQADLPALEWEGAYLHFRRVYVRAFQRAQLGNALIWVVERDPTTLIAQLFVLLNNDVDPALADGRQQAFIPSASAPSSAAVASAVACSNTPNSICRIAAFVGPSCTSPTIILRPSASTNAAGIAGSRQFQATGPTKTTSASNAMSTNLAGAWQSN